VVIGLVILGIMGANKSFDAAIEAGDRENQTGDGAMLKGFVSGDLEGMHAAMAKTANDESLKDAVIKKDAVMAKFAIENGANVNLRFESGATVLHRAAGDGSLEIVRMLLEKKGNVDARNKKGQTPLHLAAKRGRIEIVEFLIQNYADFDIKDHDGKTVLNTAVSALDNISKGNTVERQQSVVELLRSYRAKE